VLSSSKSFTAWVPNNAALQSLDPALVSNLAWLKVFVGNHISNQAYLTSMSTPLIKIKSMNGKGIVFTKTSLDEAGIVKADQYAQNGVLHIIDKPIMPKPNAFEFLKSYSGASLQKAVIQSLDTSVFVASLAVPTGIIDPVTGLPQYKPGTGFVTINRFLLQNNINSEDSLYTYIVLTDNAFLAEKAKLGKYFKLAGGVSETLTERNIIRDLTIKGLHEANKLPDTLYTTNDSVKIHLDPSAIVSSHRVSNGIVHVVNRLDYSMASKFKPIKLEGELRLSAQSSKTTTTPVRRNPVDPNNPTAIRTTYTSVLVQNHGVASYWLRYSAALNSMKYKVYWRAPRDFNLTNPLVLFPMRVTFLSPTSVTLPYKNVNVVTNPDGTYSADYSEVYLGEYTVVNYGTTDVYLVSNTSTANGLNTLILDYIKLVPVP
jgi:uncharacterized surface protein with fasciclin (FAS1) repeats